MKKIITPNDNYHYFFGYYDLYMGDDTHYPLCHRVKFMNRIPNENDVAEIGYLKDYKFYKLGETTAWNFQQGSLLQYSKGLENVIFYNAKINDKFVTIKQNYITSEKNVIDYACGSISNDGKYGLSINFGRIFDFRKGYGYAGYEDINSDITAPENDGIFLVDIEKNAAKLVFSYSDLEAISGFTDEKILVNHINFNKSGNKYVFLLRNFPVGNSMWLTSMIVSDLNNNYKVILNKTDVSHYYWMDDDNIVVYARVDNILGLYIINVTSLEIKRIDLDYFNGDGNRDIHCSTNSEKTLIVGDGYPIGDYRYVVCYDLVHNKEFILTKAKTDNSLLWDIRCDLHIRFLTDNILCYDTVENGKRQIAVVEID